MVHNIDPEASAPSLYQRRAEWWGITHPRAGLMHRIISALTDANAARIIPMRRRVVVTPVYQRAGRV
jgi:hypothetical protein